ncbi:MAG: hypothetical protein LBT65_02270, partial [Synergistaceae bacterium]|nr:hypothetical protein [Synergistaceae bacterium]
MREVVMRRFGAALIVVLLVFCRQGVAVGSEISIQTVDFYPAGVKITFRIDADGRFEFDLPGAFSSSGVRCLTREKLTSLRAEYTFVREPVSESLLALERRVDDATRAVNLLKGQRAALNQAITMLRAPFSATGEGEEEKKIRIDGGELIEYIASAQELRLEIETDLVEVGMSEQKAQKELTEAREDFETHRMELEEKKPSNSSTTLRISGTTAGPATLSFEAWSPAAEWNVEYDMNLNSETGDIAAKMNAVAWQKTGLNFDGEFSFHTRQPSSAVSPPEVYPLTVALRPKGIPLARQQENDFLSAPGPFMEMQVLAEPDAMGAAAPGAQIVIDFSHHSVVDAVAAFCVEKNIGLVCATTGLSADQEQNLREVAKHIPVFRSANFSYGVSVLRSLI